MKTQLQSKYPWKSSSEPLRVHEPQVENHWSKWSYTDHWLYAYHSLLEAPFQGRRQDVAAGGAQNHKGGTFLNTMLDVCSNRHEKSRLRHANLLTL